MDAPGAPVEAGVAEVEDAAVGGHLPVPLAVRGRRHADDGCVERLAAHGAVELGVAEGEDAAVGRDLPVPAAILGQCVATTGLFRWMLPVEPQKGMLP